MKRNFLVFCLAAVMLFGLAVCAQAECEEHVAFCTEPTTCVNCGATDVECWIVHINRNYTHDATTHFYTCGDCGYQSETGNHYTDCTASDKSYCWGCDASGVVCVVEHYWFELESDAEGHWFACSECGEAEEKYPHYASCVAPGTCEYCGYMGDIAEVDHNYEGEYGSDDEKHWMNCGDCGELLWEDAHYTLCDKGGACVECGKTGNFKNYHWMENIKLEYDASKHWETCTECDEMIYEDSHFLFCIDEPGVCYYCGYASSSLTPYHYIDENTVEFDSKNHWGICEDCGEKVTEAHSFDKVGCWCGAKKQDEITYYYNNTACSFGPRFRDQENAVTDKWFMYTPVDLSKDGTQTFDLIASNVYKIGTVTVTVAEGKLTVDYRLVSKEIKVSSEFMTIIPALEDVTTVDQEAFTAYAFGEEIDMKAVLGESTDALIYICNVVDYNTGIDGVSVKVM